MAGGSDTLTSAQIKQALRQAGFEPFRTQGDVVHIAERVRENLILDSGVRVRADGLVVSFHAKAQRSEFPGESGEALYARARAGAVAALARGYVEGESLAIDVEDPGNAAVVIDTWYEVTYSKPVRSLDAVFDEVRFALALERTARRPG